MRKKRKKKYKKPEKITAAERMFGKKILEVRFREQLVFNYEKALQWRRETKETGQDDVYLPHPVCLQCMLRIIRSTWDEQTYRSRSGEIIEPVSVKLASVADYGKPHRKQVEGW